MVPKRMNFWKSSKRPTPRFETFLKIHLFWYCHPCLRRLLRCALSFLQAVHNTEYFLRRGGLLCLSYKEHAWVTVARCTGPVTDKPKFLFSQQIFYGCFFLGKYCPPFFQIQAPHCLSWLVGKPQIVRF